MARIAGFACYQGFVYAAFYLGTNHQMQLGPFSVERAELLLTLAFMVAAFIGERLAPMWPSEPCRAAARLPRSRHS